MVTVQVQMRGPKNDINNLPGEITFLENGMFTGPTPRLTEIPCTQVEEDTDSYQSDTEQPDLGDEPTYSAVKQDADSVELQKVAAAHPATQALTKTVE